MSVSTQDIFHVFGRIGVLSFGGPAAQIALMHKELVDDRDWLTEQQFLNALSFCMLLPGPEAMQLATYAGWRLRGTLGGLIAGLLFVIPGAIFILALALTYAYFGNLPFVQALFLGVKATVLVIVLQALLKIANKALKNTGHWVVAGLAFLGIFLLNLPFPLIIFSAAIWGAWRAQPMDAAPVEAPAPTTAPLYKTVSIWLTIWLTPVLLLWVSGATFLTEIGLFFSKLAVVTFGGAYAVLAYMTQEVVTGYNWLSTAEMIDALGLAETTPGPLILVTEFVGLLAGFREGGLLLAIATGALTLWVTFTPCFLWIFAGAPYIDALTRKPRLTGALHAITAAVVGVILNLSIWFGLHVFFNKINKVDFLHHALLLPDVTSLNLIAVSLAVVALFALLKFKRSLPEVLALNAFLAFIISLL